MHDNDTVPGEVIEFSDADREELEKLGVAEPPTFHTILEVWREVLKPAKSEANSRVSPQWAQRMCAEHGRLKFSDMIEFRDQYFSKLMEMEQIILDEIETDDQCLTWATPEEDVEHNSTHYKNVMTEWQKKLLGWELEWDCTDPYAHVDIAAIAETHKIFFGPTGLTQFLENIQLRFTDEDQAELLAALEEFREEHGE